MRDMMDFTVMTMNLRFGLADDGANGWWQRKHLVARLLQRYNATFMGFQEANHFQVGFLQRQLLDHHFIGWHNPGRHWWQSNPIFHHKKWQCQKHAHFFLSDTPHLESKMPGSRWPRQCVMGIFQRGEARFLMVNTHYDFSSEVQEKSVRLILEFISDFADDLPTIITGDFNASPESAAYHLFMDNGFREVFEGAAATTFHGFTGRQTCRHIDWILYRNVPGILHRQILTDSFGGRFPSDHYPVLARFEI